MKLLIITQAVDKNHSILGFFHHWIEEFAKHHDHIHVIALQVGEYSLPENVTVHSLKKEDDRFKIEDQNFISKLAVRLQRFLRLHSYLLRLHRDYDAVFVHMNPEYLVLAGWWWRLTGKKVGLWYTHKSVDIKLRIAEMFTNIIFTASKESFRLPSKKVHVMGHGIDTNFWTPDAHTSRGPHWLSVGRLMKTKRHDVAIREAAEANTPLRIVGDGEERSRLEALAHNIGTQVEFVGALSSEDLRDEYRRAALLIHRSETGSLDKVVLEAAACGCPVNSTDSAIAALSLSPEYVREHHSLERLVKNLHSIYTVLQS